MKQKKMKLAHGKFAELNSKIERLIKESLSNRQHMHVSVDTTNKTRKGYDEIDLRLLQINFATCDLIYENSFGECPVRLYKGSYKDDITDEIVIKCFIKNFNDSKETLGHKMCQIEREARMLKILNEDKKSNIIQYRGVSFAENHTTYLGYIVFDSLICSVQDVVIALSSKLSPQKNNY